MIKETHENHGFLNWNSIKGEYKAHFHSNKEDNELLFNDYQYYMKQVESKETQRYKSLIQFEEIARTIINSKETEMNYYYEEGAVFLCDYYQSLLLQLGVYIVEENVDNESLRQLYKELRNSDFILQLRDSDVQNCQVLMDPLEFFYVR